MENETELVQLRHPDTTKELADSSAANLSPKAFREKLLDYHEKRHARSRRFRAL